MAYSSPNYEKYATKNPIKRYFVTNFLNSLVKLADLKGMENVCDIGCGEGFVLNAFLKRYPHLRVEGYDVNVDAINFARRLIPNAKFGLLDIRKSHVLQKNRYDLILVTEILEHIDYHRNALEQLSGLNFDKMIISIPNEPWFSLCNLFFRKNMQRLGKDKDHVNFWNCRDFSKIIGEYFKIVKISMPFPWIVFKCKNK